MDQGVSHKEAAAAISIMKNPKVRMGGSTLLLGTPAARMAVISPSVDMRLNVSSVPTSTPNGMVKGNTLGSPSPNRYATWLAEAEMRNKNSKSGPEFCRKRTVVKRTI